jgi:hypothetical protein
MLTVKGGVLGQKILPLFHFSSPHANLLRSSGVM